MCLCIHLSICLFAYLSAVYPCHAMPCHATPCHAMRCHAMPCDAMRCHAMPCHAMPCHAMPGHARPCYMSIYLSIHLSSYLSMLYIHKMKHEHTLQGLYMRSTLPCSPADEALGLSAVERCRFGASLLVVEGPVAWIKQFLEANDFWGLTTAAVKASSNYSRT